VLHSAQRDDERGWATSEQPAEIKKQIKTATQSCRKSCEARKGTKSWGWKTATCSGDEQGARQAGQQGHGRSQDAMLKINDLAKEIEKRKQDLGGADKMRKELDKLKDIAKGPADKMAEALKDGDLARLRENAEAQG
jgi:hypothetical protein